MVEKIDKLKRAAMVPGQEGLGGYRYELDEDLLVKLVAQECIVLIQRKIVRNGSTPENLRSRQHVEDIAEAFGIELPMNYFGV